MARRKKGRNRNRSGGWSRRKDGRLDVYVTVDTHDGPRYVRTTKRTEEKAEAWIEEVRRAASELRASPPASTPGETVAERAERWLSEYRPTVRGITYQNTSAAVLNHVVNSELAARPLAELTASDVKAWLRCVPTGPPTKNRALSGLKRLLDAAVEDGVIAENPARGVRPVRHRAKETPYLKPKEVWTYLNALSGDPYEALFAVMATSGLRPSELLALRWSDYDGSSLLVDESVSGLGWGVHEASAPKTAAGLRRVPLVSEAIRALDRHRRTQIERLLASGTPRSVRDGCLVFPSEADPELYCSRHTISSRWARGIKKAGLAHVPLYSLRHTASMLHAHAKTDIGTAMRLMGQSDPAVLLKVYRHHAEEMAVEATRKVDGLLGERPG